MATKKPATKAAKKPAPKPKKNITKISQLTPDPKNFNKHTPLGMGLLEKSLHKFGILEAVTVSSDDVILSGNARSEKIGLMGTVSRRLHHFISWDNCCSKILSEEHRK